MKFRSLTVLFVSLVAIASAQNATQSAFGRGVAQNGDNIRGNFDFEVVKQRREGSEPVVRGRLAFRSEVPAQRVVTEINLVRPREAAFVVNTKVCEFTGPAVMVRRSAEGVRRTEGRIAVRVQDRRIEGQGEPDLYRVEFFNAANTRLYRFDGRVISGNLTVRP
ncbi:MAG: hypothetical protein K1X67_23550 [Fimbriimonadaceae bacterium]|nr:hypothetical protein [Fimbriimonadaceae bacterium]